MTDQADSAEQRIAAMEMRMAFQDDIIDKLNATVIAQWDKIDALERRLAEFRDGLNVIADRWTGQDRDTDRA